MWIFVRCATSTALSQARQIRGAQVQPRPRQRGGVRRAVLEQERDLLREETLKVLEEGVIIEGTVKNITTTAHSWIWGHRWPLAYHRHVLGSHRAPVGGGDRRRKAQGRGAQVRSERERVSLGLNS